MKPLHIEYEGPVEIAPGKFASDTGDTWHAIMPKLLWTPEARRLFSRAAEAGLIVYIDEATCYCKGEGITKAQLAYWCKRACTYLGLDRGGTTNWKPFEAVFGWRTLEGKQTTPLKATLQNINYSAQAPADAWQEYLAPIDNFFNSLNDGGKGETQP